MRYIEHIVEPEKLLLSWQPKPTEGRGRMFVAELVRTGNDADLIYLLDSIEFEKALSFGFENYPGFETKQQRYEKVLPVFMKRLPLRTRGDFGRYLDSLRIQRDAEISDFALLGYSGAKLPDDDFTVVHTFENAVPPFEMLMCVQGYRYYVEKLPPDCIEQGQEATFEVEPGNEFDPRAIKIIINGVRAGYVCRGLTESFHSWFEARCRIDASVERINGMQGRPDIYLFVSVKQR
ncbi:MAG TPA: hypothetical protein HPP87_05770 [Planctomycetes bacterium]|nr:hypothetical protein [Planctomycetota bacterium]